MELSDLRLSKNMKYTALYTAMRFFERNPDIFVKEYDNEKIIINAKTQEVVYENNEVAFLLNSHENFVKLECINRILSLGYRLDDIHFEREKDVFIFKGFNIKFIVWDKDLKGFKPKKNEVIYKSRLISGVLEYKTKIGDGNDIFDYGLFEKKTDKVELSKAAKITYNDPNFIYEENRVMKYIGNNKVVKVPYGIEELESSSFRDNQYVEEIILPETLKNMGGDTFYNCKNLNKINIPRSVENMGNNPFAGCPKIVVTNESPYFKMKSNALYTADMKTLIYCSIKGKKKEFVVPDGVKIICKHTFYCCDRLEHIVLPKSLEKMENNPFSGCSKLELECKTKAYIIKDDVIYNGFKTSVIGALNRIKSKRLELLNGIKTINRNSFWNCKGIETIVFPESLEDIGYNPFVGCSNIHFESKSPYFNVVDGILYNKDFSKIICYPAWKAIGEVLIPDSVIILERGAFSGCSNMTGLNLHNVNTINKSCFTNCSSLKNLYCSDLITYIGEWAFAYCSALKKVSINRDTIVDNYAFSNCSAKLEIRNSYSNYLFESNNRFTLLGMQKAYKGKIDSILIDPPYNSCIDYIGYKDGNYEDGYYNFMLERISLSYKLLSNKGFLVINIDEGEVNELAKLCKSFFKPELVKVHKWKKIHPFFDANRNVNPNKKVVENEYIIICRKSEDAILNKIMQPYIADGKLKETLSDVPEVFDCFGTTSSAKDEINELFGRRDYFSTPKPIKLMKELIRATTSKESIIMDYFAGSGTVGHACLDLNNEDGGNRRFILVSNRESNICEKVTDKRIKKATEKYRDSYVFLK